MLTWIKIGVRSLLKNKRRSLFTVGAIALGFAAVNVFGGFTAYVFRGLEEGYIYGQAQGHLTVFKRGFLTEGTLDPVGYLLTREELARIHNVCLESPEVDLVTPQLRVSGMISNGKVSAVFLGVAWIPSDRAYIHGKATSFIARLSPFEGKELSDGVPHGIGVSRGLGEKLELELESDVILISPTVDGQMNAQDAEVFQWFELTGELLADKIVVMPLSFAQSLYDTEGADCATILLKETRQTPGMRDGLERRLREAGLDVEVKTWQELRASYLKIKDMFNVIFIFLFLIVFVIVVLSIINTISMAVLERTREIGTLRALGLKRRGVIVMFAAESGLLATFGSVLGAGITLTAVGAIALLKPRWFPPHVMREVPLEVYLVPAYLIASFVCLAVLAIGAAVLPARRAAGMGIVDALGHV